jgi:hypothetical protein
MLALLPELAQSQTREDPRALLRRSYETASRVRLTTAGPASVHGIISSISDSTVAINSAMVYVDSISMIEIGTSAGGSGTIVGAVIGGVLGFGLMRLGSADAQCSTCSWGAIALTGAGAVIGSAATRHTAWKVVWTR